MKMKVIPTWIPDGKKNSHWRESLRFIKLMKNQPYHGNIHLLKWHRMKRYLDVKVLIELFTSNLPKEVIKKIIKILSVIWIN